MADTTIVEETGRRADGKSRTRKYRVMTTSGSITENEALAAAVLAAPTTVDGMSRKDVRITESSDIEDWYEAEAIWGKGTTEPGGEFSFGFSFSAKSVHIQQAISQRGYAPPGKTAPDFGTALNVTNDGGKQRVEGLDLPVPAEVFRLSGTLTQGQFDYYQDALPKNGG